MAEQPPVCPDAVIQRRGERVLGCKPVFEEKGTRAREPCEICRREAFGVVEGKDEAAAMDVKEDSPGGGGLGRQPLAIEPICQDPLAANVPWEPIQPLGPARHAPDRFDGRVALGNSLRAQENADRRTGQARHTLGASLPSAAPRLSPGAK